MFFCFLAAYCPATKGLNRAELLSSWLSSPSKSRIPLIGLQ